MFEANPTKTPTPSSYSTPMSVMKLFDTRIPSTSLRVSLGWESFMCPSWMALDETSRKTLPRMTLSCVPALKVSAAAPSCTNLLRSNTIPWAVPTVTAAGMRRRSTAASYGTGDGA